MRRKMFKTLLLTSTLCSLFSIGVHAEWRQIETGKWNYYYYLTNKLASDNYIGQDYYVDSNGLWMSDTDRIDQGYVTVSYIKKTGQIVKINNDSFPLTGIDDKTGCMVYYNIIFVKQSDFEKGLDPIKDYKVVNENGIYKVQKIVNNK